MAVQEHGAEDIRCATIIVARVPGLVQCMSLGFVLVLRRWNLIE